VKDDERYATALDAVSARLVPLLKSHGRLRDIGRIYKDPVARFVTTHRNFQPPPHIAADPYPDRDPDLSPKLQGLMRRAMQMIVDHLPKHVIDEAALHEALKAGTIAGAGLDVLVDEPPARDNPILKLANVTLTPHSAGPTWENWTARFRNGFDNIQRVAAGRAPRWVIPELTREA